MQLLLFGTFNANGKFKREKKKNLKEDLNSSVSSHVPIVEDCVRNLLDLCWAYLKQLEVSLCLISGKCNFLFLFCVFILNCKSIWQTITCMLL